MNVIGIDPDTKAITCVRLSNTYTPPPYPTVFRVEGSGKRAEDRFHKLIINFQGIPSGWGTVDWVYIETPVMGVNAKALRDQAQVLGAIRLTLMLYSIPHSLVDNGTWKKATVGSGNANKDEIKAWAIALLGMKEGLAQDFYDAACIASFGLLHAKSR